MNRIQIFCLCLFAILGPTIGLAQDIKNYTVSGTIQDEQQAALPSATVVLMQVADSVLVGFGVTRNDGSFQIKHNRPGEFVLQVSYVGYSSHVKLVQLADDAKVDVGIIGMQQSAQVLGEVEITGDHIPIFIKKDTIEYNADAFGTRPNAVVEDLLRKLPGVEVENDGSIIAQGEEVEQVLVDGKEFFGTDPKIATKNLPADAVDKVQVFDKKSEMAEFSGIDDGETSKTINLELKEDRKQGVFGNVTAGYGSMDRFDTKLSLNRFSKNQQISVLGLANNVNKQGFSINDYIDFSGGMSSMMRASGGSGRLTIRAGGRNSIPISDGLSEGFSESLAGGVNYNIEFNKKTELRSSYFYNGVRSNIEEQVYRQNFLSNRDFETFESNDELSKNKNHRVNLIFEHDLDSTQNIRFSSSVGFNDQFGDLVQATQNINSDGLVQNTSDVTNNSDGDGISFQGELMYRKKFSKKGRNLSATVSLGINNDDYRLDLASISNFYNRDTSQQKIFQQQSDQDERDNYGLRFSYTEPLGKGKYVELNYRRQNYEDETIQDVYDIDPVTGDLIFNPIISNHYGRNYIMDRPGATFRWNTKTSNMNLGVSFQNSQLDGDLRLEEVRVSQDYFNVLPNFSWRLNLSNSSNLRVRYNTSVNEPSVTQLQPIVDNSDPLRVYIGNPNLDPEYRHNFNLHFHSFSQFSMTSIFAMLRGTYTKNQITNAQTIDEQFRQVTTPKNVDDDLNLRGYISYGTLIRPIKTNIRVNTNVTYRRSIVFVNGTENDVDRNTQTFGLRFNNRNTEVVEVGVGGSWTNNITKYSIDSDLDQKYFNHNYTADLSVQLLQKWLVATDLNYAIYTGDAFEQDEEIPIWGASLSRYFLDGDRGEFKFAVYDILDRNKGVTRSSDANYIENRTVNSLGRYFMLSFTYALQSFNPNSGRSRGGGMRMIMHR